MESSRQAAAAREELAGLEATLDRCSALAASVRAKSVRLLPRMSANARSSVQTSGAEDGAVGRLEAAVAAASSQQRLVRWLPAVEDGQGDATPRVPSLAARSGALGWLPSPGPRMEEVGVDRGRILRWLPPAEGALEAQDLARGLALHEAVLDGLVQGLALEGPADPADVGAALRKLEDRGEELFRQHCWPRLLKCFTQAVAELHAEGPETVANANSRYAADPRGFTAKVGSLDLIEAGFISYNGRPHPEKVLEQMKAEFANDEEFETSNYGGTRTTLRTEWEFVEAPIEGKVYPGEVGRPRGDGACFPGRNRKSIDALMKLPTRCAPSRPHSVCALRGRGWMGRCGSGVSPRILESYGM
jgi:hypothetical protein